jgi:hypothetical protein
MKNVIYILTSTLLMSACGQADSKKSEHSNIQPPTLADSLKVNENSINTTLLDSVDKANNESVITSGDNITKAYVSASDSSISLASNMRQDHRIFGYEKPDTKSKRLLLLSVFTNDVENNPFGCELGAYYDTSGMEGL